LRRRSAAFRACLAEELVTTGSGARRENCDLLADDIKRGRPGRGCDFECFGHGNHALGAASRGYRQAVRSDDRPTNGAVDTIAKLAPAGRSHDWANFPELYSRRPPSRMRFIGNAERATPYAIATLTRTSAAPRHAISCAITRRPYLSRRATFPARGACKTRAGGGRRSEGNFCCGWPTSPGSITAMGRNRTHAVQRLL
jgi:hypothetical protein